MAEIIKMPKLGLTMTEGTVSSWRKAEGDRVSKGEVIADVSTDKLAFEVESPIDGVLLKIIVQDGQIAKVGEPIGVAGEPGEDVSLESLEGFIAEEQEGGENDKTSSGSSVEAVDSDSVRPKSRIKASPKAKRLAREKGLDITKIKGTGPEEEL